MHASARCATWRRLAGSADAADARCYRLALRTMALDYGEARIGVALTDPTGMLAQPFETIDRKPTGDGWLERIASLVGEYEVSCIVVGLPLSMEGRAGESAARARAFGQRVAARTGVRVDYLDERWTSREAERVLREAHVKPRRRKRKVDPIAAALILSAWLARRT